MVNFSENINGKRRGPGGGDLEAVDGASEASKYRERGPLSQAGRDSPGPEAFLPKHLSFLVHVQHRRLAPLIRKDRSLLRPMRTSLQLSVRVAEQTVLVAQLRDDLRRTGASSHCGLREEHAKGSLPCILLTRYRCPHL